MKTEQKTKMQNHKSHSKPPYLLGLLGLIPLIGFFAGLVFLILGIAKYRDRKLMLIGIGGMLFSIILYSSLYYYGFKSAAGKKLWAEMAQMQLNTLIKNVEFYKIENGQYPDSLQQLIDRDEFVNISDPLRSINMEKNTEYNYKNLGSRYLLFSSGIDGITNTKDDIYPKVDTSNKNIGWTISE